MVAPIPSGPAPTTAQETPMASSTTDALVLFGATGSLAAKKIFPAL